MKAFILSAMVLALAACSSGDSDGGSVQPLTKAQEKTLQEFSQEATDVTNSTSDYGGQLGSSNRISSMKSQLQANAKVSQKGQQYKQEIGTAVQTGVCEVKISPIDGNTEEHLKLDVQIVDGANGVCPFAYGTNVEMITDSKGVNGLTGIEITTTVSSNFEVQESASLYLAMDITKYDFDLSGVSKISASESTGIATMNSTSKGSGTFYSKEHGKVVITFAGVDTSKTNLNTETFTMTTKQTVAIKFKNFTAKGVIKGTQDENDSGNVDYEYFVNGKKVRIWEFNKLFNDVLTQNDAPKNDSPASF